jgi:hypothetical protein
MSVPRDKFRILRPMGWLRGTCSGARHQVRFNLAKACGLERHEPLRD